MPITVGHDKKLGKHKIIKNNFAINEDFTSLNIMASIIANGNTKQIFITLIIKVLLTAEKNAGPFSLNNFSNWIKDQLFLNNSCKGEFIDKIKSSLNAAKIKIKGIYPNKRAKKAAGKINQKIEPYLISFCFTR